MRITAYFTQVLITFFRPGIGILKIFLRIGLIFGITYYCYLFYWDYKIWNQRAVYLGRIEYETKPVLRMIQYLQNEYKKENPEYCQTIPLLYEFSKTLFGEKYNEEIGKLKSQTACDKKSVGALRDDSCSGNRYYYTIISSDSVSFTAQARIKPLGRRGYYYNDDIWQIQETGEPVNVVNTWVKYELRASVSWLLFSLICLLCDIAISILFRNKFPE